MSSIQNNMQNLPITTLPDEVLRTPTKTIGVFDESLQELIQTMRTTMHEAKGVGLAAPQIGKSLKLAVLEYDPEKFEDDEELQEKIPFRVIVNPRITSLGREYEVMDEGCLSIPKLIVPVPRATEVHVIAQTEQGQRVKIRAKGFLARILQHEIDHLNSLLIVDRTTDKKIRKEYTYAQ